MSLPFEKFRVRTRPKSFLRGNIPISPCSVHFSSYHTFPMRRVPTFCSRPINPTLPAHIQVQGLKVDADMRQLPLYFLEDGMRQACARSSRRDVRKVQLMKEVRKKGGDRPADRLLSCRLSFLRSCWRLRCVCFRYSNRWCDCVWVMVEVLVRYRCCTE